MNGCKTFSENIKPFILSLKITFYVYNRIGNQGYRRSVLNFYLSTKIKNTIDEFCHPIHFFIVMAYIFLT